MDVLMPQLGETVAEGKITKWFKSAGDAVKPGDNLFEIETDKVSMEVPSITTGTLTEIRVQAGETALVGAVVAVIAGEGGAAASCRLLRPRSAPNAATSSARARESGGPAVAAGSPRARGRTGARRSADFRPARSVLRGAHAGARTTARRKLSGGTTVTPLARRLAGENGIDLSRMSGSGPHGRIVAADVESAPSRKGGGRAAPMATGHVGARR